MKQRALLHVHGMVDLQKADEQALRSEYEEKIREIHADYQERSHSQKAHDPVQGAARNRQHALEINKYLQQLRQYTDSLHSELKQQYMASSRNQKLQDLEANRKSIHRHIEHVNQLSAAMSSSAPSAMPDRSGVVIQQMESKMKKQADQIKKLKQQKKEMVALVNDKMATLKFIHQQELQKERHIANVLVSNHEKQIETLKDRIRGNDHRTHDHQNAELMQMREKMQKMQMDYKRVLVENQSLQKSKQSLERMVVRITEQIKQTASQK